MRTRYWLIALTLAFTERAVAATTYPLAHGGAVTLEPYELLWGDTPYGHPGRFYLNGALPMLGIFPSRIQFASPLFVWETSAPGDPGFFGPKLTVGSWNGATFQARSAPVAVFYEPTGVHWIRPSDLAMYEIYAAELGYDPCFDCNAVLIESFGHNQVQEIGAYLIPEPAAFGLVGVALLVIASLRLWRRVQ